MIRIFRNLLSVLVLLAVSLPLAALIAAATSDRWEPGPATPSAWPIGLVAFDPMASEDLRNSLLVAGITATMATILGVLIAQARRIRRYWGRPVLCTLSVTSVICPPLLAALGVRLWLAWAGLAEPALREDEGLGWWTSPIDGRWFGLIWANLLFSVPWTAWRIGRALRTVELAWIDAAVLAGASRRSIWRRIVWPVVRPAAARAAATVFVVVLLEPGAPIVLGLRRCLSVAIVEGLMRGDAASMQRSAALAVLGLLAAVVVRRLIVWSGGTPTPATESWDRPDARETELQATNETRVSGLILRMLLVLWSVVSIAPIAAVLILAGTERMPPRLDAAQAAFSGLGSALLDAFSHPALAGAIVFGSLTLGASLVLALVAFGLCGRLALAVARVVPPLAVGVGMACLPMLGPWTGGPEGGEKSQSESWVLHALSGVVDGLDPRLWSILPMVLATAIVQFPWLVVAIRDARARTPRISGEAARVHGAGRWRSLRTVVWPLAGPPLVMGAAVVFLLASSSLSPAIVVSPLADVRPLGLASIDAMSEQTGLGTAGRLGLLMLLAHLVTIPGLHAWQDDPNSSLPRS